MKIIKRDGSEQHFDEEKIVKAIEGANDDLGLTGEGRMTRREILANVNKVVKRCEVLGTPTVEQVQDIVEKELVSSKHFEVAKAYILYRKKKEEKRKQNTTDGVILALVENNNEEVKQENSNKNSNVIPTQRDYMAGISSKDITERLLLPKDIIEAHKAGLIHFHDMDYFVQHMHNCDLINLEDMLQNGTTISGTHLDKPKSFSTACNITTQIIAQVASNQYGGQTFTLSHLAPFVDVSRQRIHADVLAEAAAAGLTYTDEQVKTIVNHRLGIEVHRGVEMIQYQILTLLTTNGQTPFVSINMYLDEVPAGQLRDDLAWIIEEVLKQRIKGVKDRSGSWVTPAFPKLLYVLEEDNAMPGTKYYYLTKLAAECTAKRMVPDYISEKIMLRDKGDCYPCMGCRSFLTPDRSMGEGNMANAMNYVEGKHKYYGRFNQGVVTINLVDAACSSKGNLEEFWKIMDERLELCHRALRARHDRLMGTKSDVAPILWQDGALARLKPGETIDKLLFNGYSTISLGYGGLWETVKYMTGKDLTDPEGEAFGLKVMQMLNDYCAKWKKAENIDYSPYGTPMESTTYKFAKCLKSRFGIIPGVTDHNYITNSYHIHVEKKIDAFSKLAFESKFQRMSPGGAISYIEVPDMHKNIEAVEKVIQFIYNNIMYAELNTKLDHCDKCGYDGEIKIVEKDGKLDWQCPNCGNKDHATMHVARRTCGYIGTNFWNQGRTEEIKDRVVHLDMDDTSVEGK